MAKFVFRLATVLNLKLRLEEQQRNAFAEAKRRLDDETDKLNALKQKLLDYEEEGRTLRSRALNIKEILENEEAISFSKNAIEEQKAQVKLFERMLEEERNKLNECIKERKMYERLKEKAFEEFLEEEKHTEGVENDEHNSYVYGTKEDE